MSELAELHDAESIRCLLAIAWAAQEWSAGRIDDAALRETVRECMAEYAGESDA